ncbi:MAG: hypothetical protein J6P44_01430 [Bacteroidales bacterium]|nr:hypothetical protein [Bacteroidales bacterium]
MDKYKIKKITLEIVILVIIAIFTSVITHYTFRNQDKRAFECYQKGKIPDIKLFSVKCPD